METDIGSYLKSYRRVQEGTYRILDVLERTGISATFFFTGDSARSNEQVLRNVAAKGSEVGCHSLKHETVGDAHSDMPANSPILEDLDAAGYSSCFFAAAIIVLKFFAGIPS